jgi:8-oxo-dGTP pyrophosphatase MutT (NUDIX family)
MDRGYAPQASRQGVSSGASVAAFRSLIEHTSCTCEGAQSPCSSGIAQQTSRAEGIEALCRSVDSEPEPLATLTLLLRLCRDEHRALWENANEADSQAAVAVMTGSLAELLPPFGSSGALEAPLRTAMAEALRGATGVHPVVIAHALAQLIDDRFWHTFGDSFAGRNPYQPSVGDPMPLSSPDLPAVMDMRPTSPPWRLANRLDETRHVRLAGEWAVQFRVVFDYSLVDILPDLVIAETVIATCHPNRSLAEFSLHKGLDERTFPVNPADCHAQIELLNGLITDAVQAGASIVVLPELAVTEDLAIELQQWVRRADGPRVLVAGSYHHEDQHGPESSPLRRRNTAIAWVRGHSEPLVHDKHSPGDEPILEDIRPNGWPELRIYVTRDGWHLVIAICRDLLNPQAVHALSESGANLVLVPAMSETLMTFGGPTSQLVGANQAVVAIANNPAEWPTAGAPAGRPARALFGHPGLSRQIRAVTSQQTDAGIALLTVRDAHIAWRSFPLATTACEDDPADSEAADPVPLPSRPDWMERLAGRWCPDLAPTPAPGGRLLLRQSAVLVLMTDSTEGPMVLLSKRTADLSDYPSQWVFPGGSWEEGDTDLAATALRETREEVGLDLRSIDVVGALPPRLLLDTGFVVTPILAWVNRPVFTRRASAAEVEAFRFVAVVEVTAEPAGSDPLGPPGPYLGMMTSSVLTELAEVLAVDAAQPAPTR